MDSTLGAQNLASAEQGAVSLRQAREHLLQCCKAYTQTHISLCSWGQILHEIERDQKDQLPLLKNRNKSRILCMPSAHSTT